MNTKYNRVYSRVSIFVFASILHCVLRGEKIYGAAITYSEQEAERRVFCDTHITQPTIMISLFYFILIYFIFVDLSRFIRLTRLIAYSKYCTVLYITLYSTTVVVLYISTYGTYYFCQNQQNINHHSYKLHRQ